MPKPNTQRVSKHKLRSTPDFVDLEMKIAPAQDRARDTIEQIIAATAALLGEVGVERLSTNLVCQKAGITPPALYRYFPNKYAILAEMARRLMEAEDRIVLAWLEAGQGDRTAAVEVQIEQQIALNRALRDVARAQPGGVWILRVMRSVPTLREIRAESTRLVIEAVYERLCQVWPAVDPTRLRAAVTLAINLSTATNELILDEDAQEDEVSREFARMLALYYNDLLGTSGAA